MNALIRTVALASIAVPAPLVAQSRVVDEGSFAITRNGTPAGREVFRIVRVPSSTGDVYRASAQIAVGDRRIAPTLNTDTLGGPVSYDVAVREQTSPVLRLQARVTPGRISVLEQSPQGESSKEYVVAKRVLLLDPEVYHQYFFVALAGATPLQVVLPQGRVQGPAAIERRGADQVEVAGQRVSAVRWVITLPGGSRTDFWVDGAGRVLRVAIASEGVLAQREELPH